MDRHAARRAALRPLIASAGGDVLVVTHLPNVRYLSGFSGSNAVLIVGADADDDVLGTDGRYVDQAQLEAPGLEHVIDRDTLAAMLPRLPKRALMESSASVGAWRMVRDAAPEAEVAEGLVESLRACKDDQELELLARACAVTADALAALASTIRVGETEVVLARRLESLFADLGAEDRSFDTIVGSGPHSAIPHHQPGGRRLQPGDLVVIDSGALVDGYHADMTRTFIVGDAQPWQADLHAAVLAAQQTAAAQYRHGAELRALDTAARSVLEERGLGAHYTHGLGHGVGLEIHEAPMIGQRSTGTISAQMAITVEPGAYLPGRGGVRIEDTLVVTDAGPRILTEAPRDLRTVG